MAGDGAADRRFGLVLDCAEPERLAAFWSAALGYGILGGAGNYVMLAGPPGSPKLLLQRVAEPKAAKNRMHVDLEVDDVDAEVARLEAAGAARVEAAARIEHRHRWVVMADPEGNEFCVCAATPLGAD